MVSTVATKIKLRAPVVFLVVAAIAIPIELVPPGHHSAVDLSFGAFHFLVNVVGFVPLGLVLGESGIWLSLVVAVLISGLAETGQLVMLYRDPSVADFVGNVTGALVGALVSWHSKIRSPLLRVNKWTTFVAAAAVLGLIAKVWAEKAPAISTRGITSQGTLEACWKIDRIYDGVAIDSSGHGINGQFSTESESVRGFNGTSVIFDGKKEYIYIGRLTALRLAGSMTISAWINSSSFPYDDAAIVSQRHAKFGYQLDTTIDTGPRTIGFKLSTSCGDLMARYGATPLVVGTWYHVAGVYDAPKHTIDVYLNGKLDNRSLIGPVTGAQHSSRWPVYIGRRSDSEGFGFDGLIRDVRIYSLALTSDEIAAVMRGESVTGAPADSVARSSETASSPEQDPQCKVISETGDHWIPLTVASLGILVGVVWVGLWPSASPLLNVFCSFIAGLLFLLPIIPNVPSFNLWLIPLVTFAGSMSVVLSASRDPEP